MFSRFVIFSLIHSALLFSQVLEARSKAPNNAEVYFISPKDGESLKAPFTVKFGLKNMGVAPAGMKRDMTGHHHLLINVKKLPNLNMPIPADDNHRHFGGGQTEMEITLGPGKHTLQLLLGDHMHIPHDPVVKSKKIEITVVK